MRTVRQVQFWLRIRDVDMAELGYRLEDRPGQPSAWKRDDGAAEEAARRTEEAAARAAAEGAAKRDKKEQTLKLKQTVRRRPRSVQCTPQLSDCRQARGVALVANLPVEEAQQDTAMIKGLRLNAAAWTPFMCAARLKRCLQSLGSWCCVFPCNMTIVLSSELIATTGA